MYDSTDTRRPQRSVIDRTLRNSGLGTTEIKSGIERAVFGVVMSQRLERSCVTH